MLGGEVGYSVPARGAQPGFDPRDLCTPENGTPFANQLIVMCRCIASLALARADDANMCKVMLTGDDGYQEDLIVSQLMLIILMDRVPPPLASISRRSTARPCYASST